MTPVPDTVIYVSTRLNYCDIIYDRHKVNRDELLEGCFVVTAIIVDDENKVCQLILKLGEWERLGVEVIDICNNGEDALECIEKHKPDIVIADIRMPVYSGLELVELAQSKNVYSSFIIISGYKQFDYAQTALKLGVIDYLVKPISKDMLNLALEKACNYINEKRLNINKQSQLEYLQQVEKKQFKEELLSNIISGKSVDYSESLKDKYGLKFDEGLYQAVIITTNQLRLHKKGSLFPEKVNIQIKQIFQFCHDYIIVSKPEGIYCIFNYRTKDKSLLQNALRTLYNEIMQMKELYGEYDLTIGAGSVETSISKVSDSINRAIRAEKSKLFTIKKDIIYLDELAFSEISSSDIISTNDLKTYGDHIELFKYDIIVKIFDELEQKILSKGFFNAECLFEISNMLTDVLVSKLQIIEKSIMDSIDGMNEKLSQCTSVHKFIVTLKNTHLDIIGQRYNMYINQESKPITEAKQYIKEHYMEQLSQEEVSSKVGLSTVYFSKLFKKIENQNYIDYLTQVRIDAAKDLLRNSKTSVKVIALEVGYTDEKYFRKLFKKQTGLKPNEFRKLHS